MDAIKKKLSDSAVMRWIVLVLLAMLTFATYWFQDFFSGLKPLMESELGFSSSDFGLMISATTWANLAGMIIIGGIILDKWGIRISGIIFGGFAILGSAITAFAASGFFGDDPGTQLTWMMIGRILFGIGLETVCVLVSRTIVKWFKGHELALAFAVNMGFGRLGSALGTALSIDIGGNHVSPAVTFAATLIGIAMIGFLVYLIFDIKLDKQIGKGQKVGNEEKFKFADLIKLVSNRSFILIALLCVSFYAAVFPFMQYAPDLLVNKFGFSYDLPKGAVVELFGNATLGNAMIYIVLFIFGLAFSLIPSKIKNKSGKILSLIIIFILFVAFITSMWDTLAIWLKNGPKTASLIPLGTIVFTPIFGSIVDKKGKAATLMILGAFLLIFAHLSLSVFHSVTLGYIGLFALGIAFSLVPAAMWPSVAKIVVESRLGTAYATMFTIQNYGLAAFFWGIGKVLDMVNPDVIAKIQSVKDSLVAQGMSDDKISETIAAMQTTGEINPYNYTFPILMLVVLGVISVFLAYMLKKADKKQGYGLELPSGQKPEQVMEAEAQANIE